jgi:hypothetical protein
VYTRYSVFQKMRLSRFDSLVNRVTSNASGTYGIL